MKGARAQIAGHQRTCFAGECSPKAVAQSANTNERCNTDCDRQHHESELAWRGLQVTPADCSCPLPAQRTLSHSSPRSGEVSRRIRCRLVDRRTAAGLRSEEHTSE